MSHRWSRNPAGGGFVTTRRVGGGLIVAVAALEVSAAAGVAVPAALLWAAVLAVTGAVLVIGARV
jgi:hypothetical protein